MKLPAHVLFRKDLSLMLWKPHGTLDEVLVKEIVGLVVERATLIHDFEARQNPALLDIVEFDTFIWEPDCNRRHWLGKSPFLACSLCLRPELGSP